MISKPCFAVIIELSAAPCDILNFVNELGKKFKVEMLKHDKFAVFNEQKSEEFLSFVEKWLDLNKQKLNLKSTHLKEVDETYFIAAKPPVERIILPMVRRAFPELVSGDNLIDVKQRDTKWAFREQDLGLDLGVLQKMA